MLILYLIYLSLLSAYQKEFDVDSCQEQACYIPSKCEKSNAQGNTLVHYIETGWDFNKCEFWIALNPYSSSKVSIWSASKNDITVTFPDGKVFFSCKKEGGSVNVTTETDYILKETHNFWYKEKMNCRFTLTSSSIDVIPYMNGDIKMMTLSLAHSGHPATTYTYMRNQMKLDYDVNVRCNPDTITFPTENLPDYHYIPADAELSKVKCPKKYTLLVTYPPSAEGAEVTSLECVKLEKWQYRLTPKEGSPFEISDSFQAACRTEEKLCRMCEEAPVNTCAPPSKCPQFDKAQQDPQKCHKYECKTEEKILRTKAGISLDGGHCAPSSSSDHYLFEWTVVHTQFDKAECVSEVNCNEINPLTPCSSPGCEGIDLLNPPLICSEGHTMTVVEKDLSVEIKSINCNKSSGEWSRSDDKPFPKEGKFNCITGGAYPSKGNNTKEDISPMKGGNGTDWLLIGGVVGGGIVILIIVIIVMWLCCCRAKSKNKPAAVKSVAPSTAPSSQPRSQPPSQPLSQPTSTSANARSPLTSPPLPAVSPLPPSPIPPIVVVVKHEEVKKEKEKEKENEKNKIKMDVISIKSPIADEKSLAANSQTGEKLSERTGDNSKADNEKSNAEKTKSIVEKELSKTAGTTRENTQSDVQKTKKKRGVNHTKTEDDSKSFNEAYNEELDKKIAKKK